MKSLLLFLSLLASTFGAVSGERTGKELRCRLRWTSYSRGSPELPAAIIEAHESRMYVIRGQFDGEDSYVVGRYDRRDEEIYLPSISGLQLNLTSEFQFLTNPDNCTTEWTRFSSNDAQYFVQADELSAAKNYVGKYFLSFLWLSGQLDLTADKVYVAENDGTTSEFPLSDTDTQVLLSYSSGIEMEIVDFEFDMDPLGGNPDFVGMDEIHNAGPGTVSLTIEHKKLVRETYTITIEKTWTSTYTKTFTVRILWFKIQKTSSYSVTTTETQTRTTVEETEISVSHEVVVPPFSEVQACSTIKMTEGKSVPYSAKAKYSAKGLTSAETAQILNDEGLGVRVENDEVVKDVSGNFQATLAMDTELVVVPFNARLGCSEIALKSNEWKRRILNATVLSI